LAAPDCEDRSEDSSSALAEHASVHELPLVLGGIGIQDWRCEAGTEAVT